MLYAAFISYSHRDRRWADWLHRSIESYRPPRDLASTQRGSDTVPVLRPIFLDRAELPTSADLAATVRAALDDSAALIVVCSVAAAQSRWVNEEVRAFKAMGRAARVFCFIVDGEPATGECFPPALRFEVEQGAITEKPAAEPLAADVRPGRDDRRSALLKIIAGLLGVPLDRLRHRELVRRHRRLALVASASGVASIAFGALSIGALRARAEADRQRAVAEHQSLTARRTADFMKSLCAVSDPSESRGNTITAREVLDRGARQIESQLRDTPLVRADLTTTLGEVYASLGLYTDGMKLLKNAVGIPDRPPELTARTMVAIGELHIQRGDYAAALQALDMAIKAIRSVPAPDYALQMRVLSAYGELYYFNDDAKHARHSYEELLALTALPAARDPTMRARALEGIAQADLAEDRFDLAAIGFHKALAEQIVATGELHPRTSEILNELGSLEYLRGRPRDAIPYFRRCVEIDRRMYGAHNAITAASLNNLGRLLLEQRELTAASKLLQETVDPGGADVPETSDIMTFRFTNLALARMGLGDLKGAEPLFQKGLRAAVINKHRLLGPILTDLADLECRSGRFEQGLKRLDEARPIVATRYPDDAWRTAFVDNVRAGCLTGLRRYPEAASLTATSLPIVLKKWVPNTLYGHDALQRAVRLYARSGDTAKADAYRAQLQGT